MAITVAGTNITFNDGSVQTIKPLKSFYSIENQSTTNTLVYSMEVPATPAMWSQIIIKWSSTQSGGPANSQTFFLKERFSGVAFTFDSSVVLNHTSAGATYAAYSSGTSLFGGWIPYGALNSRGEIIISRVRNNTASQSSIFHVECHAGSSGRSSFIQTTCSASSGTFSDLSQIQYCELSFSHSTNINIEAWIVE